MIFIKPTNYKYFKYQLVWMDEWCTLVNIYTQNLQ